MEYKGYVAAVVFDEEDGIFVGRVVNTRDVIVFDGRSMDNVRRSFHCVVDEYLEDCAHIGKEPDNRMVPSSCWL